MSHPLRPVGLSIDPYSENRQHWLTMMIHNEGIKDPLSNTNICIKIHNCNWIHAVIVVPFCQTSLLKRFRALKYKFKGSVNEMLIYRFYDPFLK